MTTDQQADLVADLLAPLFGDAEGNLDLEALAGRAPVTDEPAPL